jgi:hypothetical protein
MGIPNTFPPLAYNHESFYRYTNLFGSWNF